MPKIIDLSLSLTSKATVVPGHPRLTFHPIHTHKVHGRSNTAMHFSIHTGTHVDAPYLTKLKKRNLEAIWRNH